MNRLLSLHHLTALDVPATELVSLAASAGCDAVCLFTYLAGSYAGRFPCIDSMQEVKAVRSRLQETGITVCDLEVFGITPDFDAAAMRPGLERGAILGATRATVHIRDTEEQRAAANFAEFCAMAAQFGIIVGLEFTGFSATRTIDAAARMVAISGARNGGIAADILHVFRNGMSVEDVAIHSPMVTYAQICDGKLPANDQSYYEEAVADREIPGRGDFPLVDFIAALPDDIPIAVEVPLHRLRDTGVSAAERVKMAVQGAKRVISAASAE